MQRKKEIGGSPPEVSADKVVQKLLDIAFAEEGDARAGDRLRALELLGKHFGMFREAEIQKVAADEPLAALLAELRKMRAAARRKAKADTKTGDAS